MQGKRESNAKSDALATFLSDMAGVRADVRALYESLGECVDAVDSKVELGSLEELDSLQGRVKKLLTEVKTKVEGIRAGIAEMQREDAVSESKGPRKRKLPSNVKEEIAKKNRQRLPQLPEDVLARVLGHIRVTDIKNSRLVCSMWQQTIDSNVLVLWEVRCNTMGLLPPEGTDSVLGRAASRFRSRIDRLRNKKQNKAARRKMKDLYRSYNFTSAFFICRAAICPTCDL